MRNLMAVLNNFEHLLESGTIARPTGPETESSPVDRVLKGVVEALREGPPAWDVFAGWGREELFVVLPATGLAEADSLADRLLT